VIMAVSGINIARPVNNDPDVDKRIRSVKESGAIRFRL
jgi:hypothetical protein